MKLAKNLCYSVFDSKINVYARPFFFLHAGEALRAWSDLVNDPSVNIHRHPGDFTLRQIGEFDDLTGKFSPYSESVHVATASDYLKKPEPELMAAQAPVQLHPRAN
jgi:hypothetical protein